MMEYYKNKILFFYFIQIEKLIQNCNPLAQKNSAITLEGIRVKKVPIEQIKKQALMKAMKVMLLKKPQSNRYSSFRVMKGTSPRQQQHNFHFIQGLEWSGLADPAFKGRISFVGLALSEEQKGQDSHAQLKENSHFRVNELST